MLIFHTKYCCNISGGVALNVWFTTNGMCAKNSNIYAWREQAIIEWSRRVISIVACCHGAKLCAHAARAFPIATVQDKQVLGKSKSQEVSYYTYKSSKIQKTLWLGKKLMKSFCRQHCKTFKLNMQNDTIKGNAVISGSTEVIQTKECFKSSCVTSLICLWHNILHRNAVNIFRCAHNNTKFVLTL